VTFYTGLALYNSATAICKPNASLSTFTSAISASKRLWIMCAKNPLNCAGSFKSEGLGIALFERWKAAIRTRWSVYR
jgi:predicted house-cleaning NTP pyrophosphatase (Maf/HAM1 superfamily)